MKKLLAFLLLLALLAQPCGGLARQAAYDYDELTVGTTMPLTGAFSSDLWGSGSADLDVRMLIHGYSLAEWNREEGGFRLDPSVVSGCAVTSNEQGDHVYNLVLYNDLYYSDGTPITAWDYAFSFLLQMAPQIRKIGGMPRNMDYLAGYQAYIRGDSPCLTGVHVISDYQIVLTISGAFLPFFYETALLDCVPYPIALIAPGCQVRDDGRGVYLKNRDEQQTEPAFTPELLKKTLLDRQTGYLSHPGASSGPYRLVSFQNGEAKLEINSYYKGNSAGETPAIRRLTFKQADPATMIDDMLAGKLTLLNKVTAAAQVADGLEKLSAANGFARAGYPRSGLAFVAFNLRKSALSEESVRQAIAHCMNREGLTGDYVGNYGTPVKGYYGLGQWMYRLVSGVAQPPEGENGSADAWERIHLDRVPSYDYDPAKANRLLDQAGWTLNPRGKAYDAQKGDVRSKKIGGKLVSLELTLYYPESTNIGECLEKYLAKPLKDAGILLHVAPSRDVLPMYYGQTDPDYDLLFLGTNFNLLFDPTPWVQPGSAYNYLGLTDEALCQAAQEMRKTAPGDLASYCEKWVKFQERLMALCPLIPLYSNVYFDFYPMALHGYDIASSISWAQAVIPAYMSDAAESEMEQAQKDAYQTK